MESKNIMKFSLLFCVVSVSHFCFVASRNLAEVGDQKHFHSPGSNAWSSPSHPHNNPSCQTPPTAHGGGGGIHNSPPPTPYHGGGIRYPPPPTPSHGGGDGGGGGGICTCNPPSSTTPPLLPLNPPSSTTPFPQAPPSPLVSPSPPTYINPSPPFVPDPNSPPFPCTYWFAHPAAIWVLFGYWGTVGTVFGTPAPATGIVVGRNLSLMEALGNTREDSYGALLREGTASLLNAMASKSFYFSTQQVRDGFNTAIRSEKMAASQAKLFQKANEGELVKH